MAPAFEEAPEVAPTADYPEVAHHPQYHQPYQQPPQQYQQYPPQTPVKPEGTPSPHPFGGVPPPPSAYGSQYNTNSPHTQHAVPVGSQKQSSKGTICGCTILVFILSCIIALLSAAVIGLAAGTGVEANRANDATTKLAQLSSSISAGAVKATKTVTTTATPTSTAFADLDNNCSDDPGGVTGQTYTAFTFLGNASFTMMCNKDAANTPLMSLFTSDFNTCMDACAAYTFYMPSLFGDNDNTTCTGVSFIPLWTTKSGALAGKAPGNCYLKPGEQNDDTITTPNIGTECHAGILNTGDSS